MICKPIRYIPKILTALLLVLFLLPVITCAGEQPAKETTPDREPSKLEKLSTELAKHPNDPTLLYNYGVALYQEKQYKQAANQFTKSSTLEHSKIRQAETNYNKGRALFEQATQLKATSPQEIKTRKKLLQQAGTAFHQALEQNPELSNARQGLQEYRKEMAKIKQQEEKRKKKKESKGDKGSNESKGDKGSKGDKENKGDKNGGNKSTKKQLDQASQNQQDLNKKSQGQQGKSPSQQEMNHAANQQEALRQQLEELQKKLKEDKQNTDLAKQLQKAIDKQKQAEQSLKKGQAKGAKKQQKEAAKALQQAARQSQQETDENGAPPPIPETGEEPEDQPVPEIKTPSLADDILENERKLHELRRLQMRKARPYNGKDW